MALKIRLKRVGKAHTPVYHLVVAEATSPRDGRFVEKLGTYKPIARGKEEELEFNLERVDYWASVGAKATDTANSLIKKARKKETAAAA